jgi:Tfp pilus assembly protein PilO
VRRSRRQTLIRIVESAGLALLLGDLLLYYAALRPVQNWVAGEQQRYFQLRRQLHTEQLHVEHLEKSREELPDVGKKLDAFERKHVPPRRKGFSRASWLVRTVSERSGIQLRRTTFHQDTERGNPLQRLGIEIDVEGPFPGLLKFSHALETASEFMLIREFKFQPGDGGDLALRLVADLYLQP